MVSQIFLRVLAARLPRASIRGNSNDEEPPCPTCPTLTETKRQGWTHETAAAQAFVQPVQPVQPIFNIRRNDRRRGNTHHFSLPSPFLFLFRAKLEKRSDRLDRLDRSLRHRHFLLSNLSGQVGQGGKGWTCSGGEDEHDDDEQGYDT